MNSVLFLTLRRLRTPLLLLITVYAVGTIGLVLIPGVDAAGNPAHLSFFHAFYFLSYTASTIGFGEIPYDFTDPQRLWVTVVIYMSVIGWAYTVAALLALARDSGFRLAVTTTRFGRRVRRLGEPFYLICGCGETGMLVCRGLDQLGVRFVVLDIDEMRVEELDLESFRGDAVALAADARLPENLLLAGITHRRCLGVIALTNDDEANLAVAIAVKLLNPRIPVLCRAMRQEIAANMASFGTDHIINPFRAFGEHLWDALHAPNVHALVLRLTELPGGPTASPKPPPHGRWIICGYGRFGREVLGSFAREGLEVAIIDPAPPDESRLRFVRGLGTEARTLLEAGAEHAVGIVAGTDDDVNNLSIVMTARALNPDLFVVTRQNLQANRPLFDAFHSDMTMVSARIIANGCLALISTPLLAQFLRLVREQDDAWAASVSARLAQTLGDVAPGVWGVTIDALDAPAIVAVCGLDPAPATVGLLLRDARERGRELACVALLLARSGELTPMPEARVLLQPGDALLFAGTDEARTVQSLVLRNVNVRDYVRLGKDVPGGWVWQWLTRRRSDAARASG